MGLARATLLVLAALLPVSLSAQTLYKLVDKAGKVSYADRVPKGFDGEVTPLAIDPAANANSPVRSAPAKTEGLPRDHNSERREARTRLQLAFDRAAARLAAARKALADGAAPNEDEYQTIQQRFDARPDTAGPRANCRRQSDANGRAIWVCPTIVPGEKYRDRQSALEDAVREAEAQLAEAETAFRKGTD